MTQFGEILLPPIRILLMTEAGYIGYQVDFFRVPVCLYRLKLEVSKLQVVTSNCISFVLLASLGFDELFAYTSPSGTSHWGRVLKVVFIGGGLGNNVF